MYDFVKNLNLEKITPLAIAAVCFAAVFIAGFGAGKLHSGTGGSTPAKRTLSNYTTNASGQENKNSNATSAKNSNSPESSSTKSTASGVSNGECYIKGSKSKIYHLPGGSFYDRTKAVECFTSETDAQAAGYTKSSR